MILKLHSELLTIEKYNWFWQNSLRDELVPPQIHEEADNFEHFSRTTTARESGCRGCCLTGLWGVTEIQTQIQSFYGNQNSNIFKNKIPSFQCVWLTHTRADSSQLWSTHSLRSPGTCPGAAGASCKASLQNRFPSLKIPSAHLPSLRCTAWFASSLLECQWPGCSEKDSKSIWSFWKSGPWVRSNRVWVGPRTHPPI